MNRWYEEIGIAGGFVFAIISVVYFILFVVSSLTSHNEVYVAEQKPVPEVTCKYSDDKISVVAPCEIVERLININEREKEFRERLENEAEDVCINYIVSNLKEANERNLSKFCMEGHAGKYCFFRNKTSWYLITINGEVI